MSRGDWRSWSPADEASRETLIFLQKWQRRDLNFYGGFALLWLGLLGWQVWTAVNGSWWSWITAVVYVVILGLYVWRTHRAFHRWRMIEEILSTNPH